MALVTSARMLTDRFKSLGWASLPISEVSEALEKASVPAAEMLAYLDALIAAPTSLNDQTIAGCPAATANKITGFLRGKGLVI